MSNSIVANKASVFAVRVTKAYKYLCETHKRIALFYQFLRSGTAIGALAHEAIHAQSRKDFANKMNIALKEANETYYWIQVIHDGGYINEKSFKSILHDCNELVSMLVKIVKTTKLSIEK